MIDLTTLEGKDTKGKVQQLCYKAIHPHDSIKDLRLLRQFAFTHLMSARLKKRLKEAT